MYKDVREGSIGEYLKCLWELPNPKDSYAIAVLRDVTIASHRPKKSPPMFFVCTQRWQYLRPSDGETRFSADLLQGGLEIPNFPVCKNFAAYSSRSYPNREKLSDNINRPKISENTVMKITC